MNEKRMEGNGFGKTNWDFKEGDAGDDICDSTSIGSMSEDSMDSVISYASSELTEEADSSSTSTSSSSSRSNGPYELSQLMNHLPIKRGLSMFYEGKSQSFTSLARVQSKEDLPKKDTPYRKKMKTCKSYGGCLYSHKILHSPKATISKKSSRGSSLASVLSKRGSFPGSSRPSSIAVRTTFDVQTS